MSQPQRWRPRGGSPSSTITPPLHVEPWAPDQSGQHAPAALESRGRGRAKTSAPLGECRCISCWSTQQGRVSQVGPGLECSSLRVSRNPRDAIYPEHKVNVPLEVGHEAALGGQHSSPRAHPAISVKGPAHQRLPQGGGSSWQLQPVLQSPGLRPDLQGGGGGH